MDPQAPSDDVGPGVLQNLLAVGSGPTSSSWTLLTADLSAFLGQTVRLRFACVHSSTIPGLPLHFGVDSVSVEVEEAVAVDESMQSVSWGCVKEGFR